MYFDYVYFVHVSFVKCTFFSCKQQPFCSRVTSIWTWDYWTVKMPRHVSSFAGLSQLKIPHTSLLTSAAAAASSFLVSFWDFYFYLNKFTILFNWKYKSFLKFLNLLSIIILWFKLSFEVIIRQRSRHSNKIHFHYTKSISPCSWRLLHIFHLIW